MGMKDPPVLANQRKYEEGICFYGKETLHDFSLLKVSQEHSTCDKEKPTPTCSHERNHKVQQQQKKPRAPLRPGRAQGSEPLAGRSGALAHGSSAMECPLGQTR